MTSSFVLKAFKCHSILGSPLYCAKPGKKEERTGSYPLCVVTVTTRESRMTDGVICLAFFSLPGAVLPKETLALGKESSWMCLGVEGVYIFSSSLDTIE